MKLSYYNRITIYGDFYLFYNSNTDACLMLPEKRYKLIEKNNKSITKLKSEDSELFKLLVENAFIVKNDYNEKADYLISRQIRRYSTEFYHVILNPTMDCNLNCWYCYESHVEGSHFTDEVIDKIKKHFVYKIEVQPFRELKLSFFGGEPLKELNRVIELIEFCKDLSIKHDFKLSIDFTTNGTLVDDRLISAVKEIESDFQITIDGNEEKHNKVRYDKQNKLGSFDTIVSNIIKLSKQLDKVTVRIRINFDLKTLENIDDIFDNFNDLDKNKLLISFHKVWQVEKPVDSDVLIYTLNSLLEKGFAVDYHSLSKSFYTCYADNYNSVVINFDGKIYKCTSRDFNDENAEGELNEFGHLIWDFDKLYKRLSIQDRDECTNCNLFPSCSANCSQNLLEGLGGCVIKGLDLSVDDYMAYNFKLKLKN